MHQLVLLKAENQSLRQANEALSKRRRAKKTRVRQGGVLTVEDTLDILAQKDAEEQVRRDKRSREGGQNEGQSTTRRCSTCGKTGHNTRTCQEAIEISSLSDSE